MEKTKMTLAPHTQKAELLQALELEESVLGALLIERDALTSIIDILKRDSFCAEQHTLIYDAILRLFNDNKAIDPRTVVNQLRKDNTLEKIGGATYIAGLTNSVASAAHIEDHAHIITAYAARRAMVRLSKIMHYEAYDKTQEPFALLDKMQQALFDIGSENIHKNYEDIGQLMAVAFKDLEAKKENPSNITGTPTGFLDLDRFILGWQKSDFVVVAARPAMGKTTLLLTFLRNAAVDHQIPVAFFSLEMSSLQLVNRMISAESGIPGEKIKRGSLEAYESRQLYHKTAKLAQAPIYIDDTPSLSLFEFRAKCRRLKMQKNIQLVFVDYLQLMVDDTARGSGNREQQIAAISRGVKSIAKELDICIVVTSQLSRSVEIRAGDRRPLLSDLRESGSIEQDADMVIFLFRPEYYGVTESDGEDTRDLAEIIIAKHRNGPTGKICLKFIASLTKFTDFQSQEKILESKINRPF